MQIKVRKNVEVGAKR